MPKHMECRDGYFWLERAECPPRPQLGYGYDADRAHLEWKGPDWYGPGAMVRSYRDDRDVIYYERAQDIASDVADEIRDLAFRLREARRFSRMV